MPTIEPSAFDTPRPRAGLDAREPDHALWIALLSEDEPGVVAALKAGANPNMSAPVGQSEQERREQVRWSQSMQGMASGAGSGWALGLAAAGLMVEAVRALLAAGADPFRGRPEFRSKFPVPIEAGYNGDAQPVEKDALQCLLSAERWTGGLREEAAKVDAIANQLLDNMRERVLRGDATVEQLNRWKGATGAGFLFRGASWSRLLWMARNGFFSTEPERPVAATNRIQNGQAGELGAGSIVEGRAMEQGAGVRANDLAHGCDEKANTPSMLYGLTLADMDSDVRSIVLDRDWHKIAIIEQIFPQVQEGDAFKSTMRFVQSKAKTKVEAVSIADEGLSELAQIDAISASLARSWKDADPWRELPEKTGHLAVIRRAAFALSAQGVGAMKNEIRTADSLSWQKIWEKTLEYHWRSAVGFGHAQWEDTKPLLLQSLEWIDGHDPSSSIPLQRQEQCWEMLLLTETPRSQWLRQQALERVLAGKWSANCVFTPLLRLSQRLERNRGVKRANGALIQKPSDGFLYDYSTKLIETHFGVLHEGIHHCMLQAIKTNTPMLLEILGGSVLLRHETEAPGLLSSMARTLEAHSRHWLNYAVQEGSYRCARFLLESIDPLREELMRDPKRAAELQESLKKFDHKVAKKLSEADQEARIYCVNYLQALIERAALNAFLAPKNAADLKSALTVESQEPKKRRSRAL